MLDTGVRFCPHDGTPLTETSGVSTVRTPAGDFELRPQPREIPLPAMVGGRYRLEELRGGGGMAKVYRAVDVTLEREVAVKLINPDLRSEPEFDARFQREARIASQLSDPHIVVVHDFGIDATHGPFLVMEYLQGTSLRERLANEGSLPLKAGLQLSAQLMLALIHAHDRGIVHRDIKPDNIFLLNVSGVRLHVRVLDFGIARIYRGDAASRAETLTNVGAVLGTPRYMSPEQLAGQPVDARSDIYSAALVIHEAITGHLPYVSGKKLCELCPEATPSLQELLDHCLKQNPAERPPNAVEVYLRLQELGKASGILLLPPGTMDKLLATRHQQSSKTSEAADPSGTTRAEDRTTAHPPGRRQWLIALLALLGLTVIALATKLLFFHEEPTAEGESLQGYGIGAPQAEAVKGLRLGSSDGPMNPWATGRPPAYLGHVLRAEDLQLPPKALANLEMRATADGKLAVLSYEGKVRAMVVQEPHHATTARGVKTGADASRVLAAYHEAPSQVNTIRLPPELAPRNAEPIEVRRYDPLGIGFEIQNGHVMAITLYPPAGQP
jgi:serine/threonine protein kinase